MRAEYNKLVAESDKTIEEYSSASHASSFKNYEKFSNLYNETIEKINSKLDTELEKLEPIKVTEYIWHNSNNSNNLVVDETMKVIIEEDIVYLELDSHQEKEANGLSIFDAESKLEGKDKANKKGEVILKGYYTSNLSLGDRYGLGFSRTMEPKAYITYKNGFANVKLELRSEITNKVNSTKKYILEPVFEELK